jgi:hypothetical protein
MLILSRWVFCFFCLLGSVLPGWAAAPWPVLTLQLRPTYAQPGRADGLAVAYTLTPPSPQPRPLDLQFDLLAPALLRNTDQVTNLMVTDAKGPVAFAKPVVDTQDGMQH